MYTITVRYSFDHQPAMPGIVMAVLAPKKGERVLDVTTGLGGHSRLFAEAIGADGSLICLDADERNLHEAERRLSSYPCKKNFMHSNFRDLPCGIDSVDVIFADLGLSSPHLDDASRGFSFRNDATLDMRFDQSIGGTAAECIAEKSIDELSRILRDFGEVRQSFGIARHLKEQNPSTTFQLKQCVQDICGYKTPSILPQVFQALRIAVNDEMGALESLLSTASVLLPPTGRIGIISYHSLEDRMVKRRFRDLTTTERDTITGQNVGAAPFELLTKKALQPDAHEIEQNPRVRSAKFRAIRRIV